MKCAFLDRDGVINFDYGYVGTWERFDFIPNVIEGIKLLQKLEYSVFVVTNQSGIARGYYTEEEFLALDRKMNLYLRERGVFVERTYYCPHHPTDAYPPFDIRCRCRKPKPGLIEQCMQEYAVDLSSSILIGYKISDYCAGVAAGIGRVFLVESRYLQDTIVDLLRPKIFRDVLEIAESIAQNSTFGGRH